MTITSDAKKLCIMLLTIIVATITFPSALLLGSETFVGNQSNRTRSLRSTNSSSLSSQSETQPEPTFMQNFLFIAASVSMLYFTAKFLKKKHDEKKLPLAIYYRNFDYRAFNPKALISLRKETTQPATPLNEGEGAHYGTTARTTI